MTSLLSDLARGFLTIEKRWQGEAQPFQVTRLVGNALTNHGKRSIIRALTDNPLSPYPLALDADTKIEVIDTSLARITPVIHQFSGKQVDAGFPTHPSPNEVYYEFTFESGEVNGQWDSIYLLGKKSDSEWVGLTKFTGYYDTWGEKASGEEWTVKYTFTMTSEGTGLVAL